MLKACVLIAITNGSALGVEPSEAAEPEPEEKGNGRSLAVLPGAFYGQETGLGLAVFGSYTFRLKNTGSETWPSSVTAAAVYTFKNQASFSVWSSFYLGEANDWAIESEAFVEHFPTQYYGIGPTSEPSYQIFTRRRFRSDFTVRRRVRGSFYTGLAHHLAFVDVVDAQAPQVAKGDVVWTDDDQLGSGTVVGENGTRVHGLGVLARWDTRDNNQSTRSGALIDLELAGHPTWLGSEHPFVLSRLDLRGFVGIGRGVLGAQWLTQVAAGEVPFTSMVELGGDEMLRGMFQGRYRDKASMSAQLELRYPVIWRFGVAGFASSGHVFPTLGRIADRPPRWTAGGGIRFELDESSHSTIRLDVGSGPDGTGFIFTFGEAF